VTAGGPSRPLATLTTIGASANAALPVSLTVQPTWVSTITIVAPSGAVGGSTLRIGAAGGTTLVLTGQPFGTALTFALPVGVYTVSANATGAPYGVPTQGSASTTVPLLHGNAAVWLQPTFQFTSVVNVRLIAPQSATVAAGGSAIFTFTVTNNGTGPVTFHMVGAPAYWGFAFSFTSATLGVAPGTNSISGEVTVTTPPATPVAHPPVSFQAELSSGQVIGSTNPGPTLNVLPYFGLVSGAIPSAVSGVAPYNASIPFYVKNTGNVPESVDLSIADSARLASLGWTGTIQSPRGSFTNPASFSPGENLSFSVSLVAPSAVAPLPGTVSILAYVLEGAGQISSTVTLPVPLVTVNPGHGPTTVTGPSVGSEPAYPIWFVPLLSFVPVIALVLGVLSYRWYRSRKWVRR